MPLYAVLPLNIGSKSQTSTNGYIYKAKIGLAKLNRYKSDLSSQILNGGITKL